MIHLQEAGVSLLLDDAGPGLPRVVHWGAALGDVSADEVAALVAAGGLPRHASTSDEPATLTLLPQYADGWSGTPGVTGHRDGAAFSPRWVVMAVTRSAGVDEVVEAVVIDAVDLDAFLSLRLELELLAGGLIRTRAAVTNDADGPWTVGSVDAVVPVPAEADEILDFTGRLIRERSPQRHRFTVGTHLRETRLGRGHEAAFLLAAGREGFRNRAGEVWAVHVGWSGNTRTFAERVMPSGARVIGGGELLLAGEVRLSRGETYASPWTYLAYGDGLDAVGARFHRFLRARAGHPTSPRKVSLNVWEAVYFNHDLPQLLEIAERAAAVGVERYVLDDGWFRGRRDDIAGLGDWVVDPDVWPDGLHPLVDRVTALGMEFGLWFEPEMVNPDSELARAHPEWILQVPGRTPPEHRHQQVLDLAEPGAWQHVFGQMDAVLREYPIGYVKWDHNRSLIDAAHQATGAAGVHAQTAALYALLDALREAHPRVDFESCASGGGRIDLGVMERAERVWASDTIDALERQQIQDGTTLLLPPELIGSHVGAPRAHTTGRTHALSFRAATAFFGHFGIEWNLTRVGEEDLAGLAAWVEAYKRHRGLLHSGTVVRADIGDPALHVHGVVAADRRKAIFAAVQLRTSVAASTGRVRLPGLDPDAVYEVSGLAPGTDVPTLSTDGTWWPGPLRLSGRALGTVGLQLPAQLPERSLLLHLIAQP